MTGDEAMKVLAYLSAAFQRDVTDDTARVWADLLRDVTIADGRAAATRCAAELTFFPAPAEFHQRAKAEQRRREASEVRALPAPMPPREVALGRVAELRRVLDATTGPGR